MFMTLHYNKTLVFLKYCSTSICNLFSSSYSNFKPCQINSSFTLTALLLLFAPDTELHIINFMCYKCGGDIFAVISFGSSQKFHTKQVNAY